MKGLRMPLDGTVYHTQSFEIIVGFSIEKFRINAVDISTHLLP